MRRPNLDPEMIYQCSWSALLPTHEDPLHVRKRKERRERESELRIYNPERSIKNG